MKTIIIRLTLFLNLAIISNCSAQNFLTDYFNGNKDSLIAEATKLINMPSPTFESFTDTEIEKTDLKDESLHYQTVGHYFSVRDGHKIFAYQFPKESPNTILLIHGVKSDASDYLKTGQMLQEATNTDVYAIDLRGHGKSYGKSGDVNYINQYADDLADIVGSIRKNKPNGKIILVGHSMGGGIILRYAMTNYEEKVDAYLLLAPLIGHNSPALPQGRVTENDGGEPFMKIHIGRIIGLKMMNEIIRHDQDSLPVLFFNLPKGTPLRTYTYRANISMAPIDYAKGLKAVKVPMLVLTGSEDETFNAKALKKAVLEHGKGKVHIVKGASHEGILTNPKSFLFIKEWYLQL